MKSSQEARVTPARQTPDNDHLSGFPVEGLPGTLSGRMTILAPEDGDDGDAMTLFDTEGEPERIFEVVPAPPPAPAKIDPAPDPTPFGTRVMPAIAAFAVCAAIAVLVIAAGMLWRSGTIRPDNAFTLASSDPADFGLAATDAGFYLKENPDRSRNAALGPFSETAVFDPPSNDAPPDPPTPTTAPVPPREMPLYRGVSPSTPAPAARPDRPEPISRGTPRPPVPAATAGSTNPSPVAATGGETLRPTRVPVTDVARTVLPEVTPPPPIVTAPAPPAPTPSPAPVPSLAPAPITRTVVPPAAAPPAAIVAVNEEAAVRSVINRYRAAYNELDAGAAHAVWPSVDAKALGRAFERLESQALVFDACQIAVNGSRATAACGGDARYVPKVGNRSERVEARQWTFDIRKSGEQWTISGVNVR